MNANKQDAGGLPAPDYYIVRSDGATLLFTSKASANAQMHELTSKGYRCSLEPVATLETLQSYGEQCRAASVASGEAEELAQWLDAKFKRHGEIEDKRAADLLRALSRGVPEGMALVPKEPTEAMLEAAVSYDATPRNAECDTWNSVTWSLMVEAAIAAQRKEGE